MEAATSPVRLERSPLVDAIFEIRFKSSNQAVEDILPGLLFSRLGASYPSVSALPLASIPREVREGDPNLRYRSTHRLAGERSQIQVGQRTLWLSCGTAYPGWRDFKSEIVRLLGILNETGLVESVERFAFRYINLLQVPEGERFTQLNGHFELFGKQVRERGFHLRTEIPSGTFTSIVQLVAAADATLADGRKLKGLLVDVDTFNERDVEGFWDKTEVLLDNGHAITKDLFFSLLTRDSLDSLGAIWE